MGAMSGIESYAESGSPAAGLTAGALTTAMPWIGERWVRWQRRLRERRGLSGLCLKGHRGSSWPS